MKDWNGSRNSIFKTIGASNHTDKEREKNDYYATDPVAIDKLLQVERPSHSIWECAAGDGHLSKRLTEKGFSVYSTDIIRRCFELDGQLDFLEATKLNFDCDIITNPPYKFAEKFILKSLDLIGYGHKVYMLLKLTFLEGKARYKELFSKYPPKVIYVFSQRVMCAKNGDFEGMKAGGGSAVCYAWFVWQKGYKGRTIVDWI